MTTVLSQPESQSRHMTMKPVRLFPIILSIGLAFAWLGISATRVMAERMSSDSYVIQFGNFNVTSGEKTGGGLRLTDTVGQVIAGPFGLYGDSDHFVGAGFQYIYQIGTFAFSISDLEIDLGLLTPGVHNTATNTLTVSTRGAGGFTVYAYQNHPLRLVGDTSPTPAEIPATACDGSPACTIFTASPWLNQSIPGFGLNVEGDTAQSDFTDATYFRPFANLVLSQPMQPVMSSTVTARNESVTVTYKAGIAGNQEAGDYQAAVIYVAVPGY